jgi:hypothetical protein
MAGDSRVTMPMSKRLAKDRIRGSQTPALVQIMPVDCNSNKRTTMCMLLLIAAMHARSPTERSRGLAAACRALVTHGPFTCAPVNPVADILTNHRCSSPFATLHAVRPSLVSPFHTPWMSARGDPTRYCAAPSWGSGRDLHPRLCARASSPVLDKQAERPPP